MAGPWEDYASAPAKPAAKKAVQAGGVSIADARKQLFQSREDYRRRTAHLPPAAQEAGLRQWQAHPDTKRLQAVAFGNTRSGNGSRPTDASPLRTQEVQQTTRKQELREIARKNVLTRLNKERATGQDTSAGIALGSAFNSWLPFEAGDRIAATARRWIPGVSQGKNFDEELEIIRNESEFNQAERPGFAVPGAVGGALTGGYGVTKAIQGTGNILSKASRAPAIVREGGKLLTGSQTLRKGERLKNTLKLTGTGAAFGAAEGASRDLPVGQSAAIGAVAPLALVGGGKFAAFLGSHVADILGASSLPSILKRFLPTLTQEDLALRAQAHRDATGAEPTVAELLTLGERRAIDGVVGRSAGSREAAITGTRDRVNNVGPELASRTREITEPNVDAVRVGMAEDLAASAGRTEPIGDDFAVVARAAEQPLDMNQLASTEARNIMAPFDDVPLVNSLTDLYPTTPELLPNGSIREVSTDPEVTALIRRVSGLLGVRPEGQGIKGREITNILSKLRDIAYRGDNEGLTAQSAIKHIEDTIAFVRPEAAEAIDRMRTAFAARRTMGEGMAEGGRTRNRGEVPASGDVRSALNAYDTPQGSQGRVLGQTNRLVNDFGNSTNAALSTAENIVTSGNTQRAIAANISDEASEAITNAARAQTTSVRNLAGFAKEGSIDDASATLGDIGTALAGLNPGAMATTKARLIVRMAKAFRLPKNKAMVITEMLFSQNPQLVQRALGSLRTNQQFDEKSLRGMIIAAASGTLGAESTNMKAAPEELPPEELPPEESDIPGLIEQGNIDLTNRPQVTNEDGSVSTVRSISVGFDDGVYLIPTVIGDRVVSDDEAIEHFRKSGEHLGKFKDTQSADAYAETLHQQQASQIEEEAGPWQDFNAPMGTAGDIVAAVFPNAEVTEVERDPDSRLGRANPDSWHNTSSNAVDIRPIPGMTFEEYVQGLQDAGYNLIEAIDEVNNPSSHATGPHWHVVFE